MWGTIAQFRWIDALDVLIVAFAVYHLLLMFKGTKALQMIVGLGLVYFASRVALGGGLMTVNWVLQNLLGVSFLLIIILFQPELRRALASFGVRSRLLRAFSRHQDAHIIDEVVRTAISLAGKKIVPPSAGTFPTHGPLFIALLVGVIVIVGGLTYFPVLALGPIVEHLMLASGALS